MLPLTRARSVGLKDGDLIDWCEASLRHFHGRFEKSTYIVTNWDSKVHAADYHEEDWSVVPKKKSCGLRAIYSIYRKWFGEECQSLGELLPERDVSTPISLEEMEFLAIKLKIRFLMIVGDAHREVHIYGNESDPLINTCWVMARDKHYYAVWAKDDLAIVRDDKSLVATTYPLKKEYFVGGYKIPNHVVVWTSGVYFEKRYLRTTESGTHYLYRNPTLRYALGKYEECAKDVLEYIEAEDEERQIRKAKKLAEALEAEYQIRVTAKRMERYTALKIDTVWHLDEDFLEDYDLMNDKEYDLTSNDYQGMAMLELEKLMTEEKCFALWRTSSWRCKLRRNLKSKTVGEVVADLVEKLDL